MGCYFLNELLEYKKVASLLLGNLLYTDNRKLVGFHIKAINKPGALADIASVFKEYEVNIWTIVFSSRVKAGEKASITVMADLTGTKVSPEELISKLMKLDKVAHVDIIHPQMPMVLTDTYHFPIIDDKGLRYILISESGMKAIVVDFMKKFGSSTAQAFLFYQGYIIGESFGVHLKNIGIKDLKNALKALMLFSTALGRYRGEIVSFYYSVDGEIKVILNVYDNWECSIAKKHGIKGPASHYERGKIAGLIHYFTGKDVKVVETECIAKGDAYCRFIVVL